MHYVDRHLFNILASRVCVTNPFVEADVHACEKVPRVAASHIKFCHMHMMIWSLFAVAVFACASGFLHSLLFV